MAILPVHDFEPGRPAQRPRSGDLFAVSANLLHGLYLDDERTLAEALVRGGWAEEARIREWLRLRGELSSRGRRHPDLADWLVEQDLIDRERIERLQSSSLAGWLEQLRSTARPEARAGDSIYIYRIP